MNDVFWALKPGFGFFALINDLILLNPLTLLVSEVNYLTSYLTALSPINLLASIYTKIVLGFNTLCHLLIAQDLMLGFANFRALLSNQPSPLSQPIGTSSEVYINSNSWVSLTGEYQNMMSGEEVSSFSRRQRASSPVVGYNFKVGDFYPSTTLKFYPSIIRSLSDVTRGVRRAAWYFSPTFNDLLKENFGNYMIKVAHRTNFTATPVKARPNNIAHNASFYNFFYILKTSNNFINIR
jgi:hypothetical protein